MLFRSVQWLAPETSRGGVVLGRVTAAARLLPIASEEEVAADPNRAVTTAVAPVEAPISIAMARAQNVVPISFSLLVRVAPSVNLAILECRF